MLGFCTVNDIMSFGDLMCECSVCTVTLSHKSYSNSALNNSFLHQLVLKFACTCTVKSSKPHSATRHSLAALSLIVLVLHKDFKLEQALRNPAYKTIASYFL